MPKFKQCAFWDIGVMTEMFRLELITLMVKRKVRLAKQKDTAQPALEVRPPIKPKWATLIARVFGEIPIKCPRCGTAMDLKEFIFDVRWITKVIPELSRAPPKITFNHNVAKDGLAYAQPEDATTGDDGGFNQTVLENDDSFNQESNW